MGIQQECLRKDMAHTLVFPSTLFLITGLQASFQCHGVCYIYYGMLEHVLLALSMYVYWHGITVYTAWNSSIYTNVHLSLYNIYIIARSGMYNIYIWLWNSTLACHGVHAITSHAYTRLLPFSWHLELET